MRDGYMRPRRLQGVQSSSSVPMKTTIFAQHPKHGAGSYPSVRLCNLLRYLHSLILAFHDTQHLRRENDGSAYPITLREILQGIVETDQASRLRANLSRSSRHHIIKLYG